MIDLASLVETRFGTWLAVFKLFSRNIPLHNMLRVYGVHGCLGLGLIQLLYQEVLNLNGDVSKSDLQQNLPLHAGVPQQWDVMSHHGPQAQFRNYSHMRNVGEMWPMKFCFFLLDPS